MSKLLEQNTYVSPFFEDVLKMSIFIDKIEEKGVRYETQIYFGKSKYKLILKIFKI